MNTIDAETLATEVTNFVQGKTTDQNTVIQALETALQQCRTGRPTEQTGRAGGGTGT